MIQGSSRAVEFNYLQEALPGVFGQLNHSENECLGCSRYIWCHPMDPEK